MEYIDYSSIETISDIVMILGKDASIKMNTRLGNKSKDGFRQPFMSGFAYNSSRYVSRPEVASIKRNFDSYLSIEKYQNQSFYIQIRLNKMMIMQMKLEEAANKWILSNEMWGMSVDNQLYIKGTPNPIFIENLPPNNKVLRLDPIVLNYEGIYDKGIRLTINDVNDYVDMTADNFMGLLWVFKSFDLYSASCTQINSIPICQTPAFVKEIVTMLPEDNGHTEIHEGINKTVMNRKPKQRTSFFDD